VGSSEKSEMRVGLYCGLFLYMMQPAPLLNDTL